MGMICYVLLNMCCGKFKKISIPMYILATLFILKYIFIVAEPATEETLPAPMEAVVESVEPAAEEAIVEAETTDTEVVEYSECVENLTPTEE